MMKEIERFTKTPIKPMKMPTAADVAARRIGALKETIRKTIDEGDLDLYLSLVEELVEEGPHDVADVAAAAAKLASATRPIAPEAEIPVVQEVERRPSTERRPSSERRPSPRSDSGRGRPPFQSDANKVRLSMSVGKREGIRPSDVVGSIANEADVPGRDIGPIDIRDSVTYVTVPAALVDQILTKVGRARFRGRPVNIRVATGAPEGDAGPRRYAKKENSFVPFGKKGPRRK
jgi:ATP-dependent RNA helicase DeaD